MNTALRLPALCLSLLYLAACGEQPRTPPPQEPPPVKAVPVAAEPRDDVERLLQQAATAAPGPAADRRMDAAQLLLDRGDAARAAQTLQPLAATRLSSGRWVRFTALAARAETATGAAVAALARLDNPALQSELASASPGLRVDAALARAGALAALGRHLDAARERALIQAWISDGVQRNENAGAIVRALGAVPLVELAQAGAAATSDDWRAWLEFSQRLRDIRPGPATQRAALADWRARYGRLPVLEASAGELLGTLEAGIATPARIALLLPLSGRAGGSAHAVLDGYLGEYMAQLRAGEQLPSVAVLDTDAAGGFKAAYARAIADGAQLVIGPLLKEDLATFAQTPPTVPTLALNFTDGLPANPALYQFGLDPRDELQQLMHSARAAGKRRLLILNDSSERSRASATEFARQWQALGGTVLDTQELRDLNDYRRNLEQTLLIADSNERAQSLSRLIGMPVVAEPRRRADLDLLVLLADPGPARSIRPMLAFIYAGDLPLWGTSQSYGGRIDAENDRDLDAVRLLDMPWFSPAEAPLRDAVAGAHTPGVSARLAALGVDACRLQSRLALLDALPGGGLGGATGELARDAGGRIHRSTTWYAFTNGMAQPDAALPPLPEPPAALTPNSTEGASPWTGTAPAAIPPQP